MQLQIPHSLSVEEYFERAARRNRKAHSVVTQGETGLVTETQGEGGGLMTEGEMGAVTQGEGGLVTEGVTQGEGGWRRRER